MHIAGWSRTNSIEASVLRPRSSAALRRLLPQAGGMIARGQGRSYGDSALAPRVLDTRSLDHLLAFDEEGGLLHCQAGVTLGRIIDTFLPRGWFPAVVPGTRLVSVGGAIASDVHGKNHHQAGSFCDHLESLTLCLPGGDLMHCSRQHNAALFRATCGGMGLTGIIVDAHFRLRRIAGDGILQRTMACAALEEVIAGLEGQSDARYSVAWLDLTSRRQTRGLVLLGEHADGPVPHWQRAGKAAISIPAGLPVSAVRRPVIRLHNQLHWHRGAWSTGTTLLPAARFFFPLDGIANWNHLYGPDGFLQYQFVVPREGGAKLLQDFIGQIHHAGIHVSLAVLKVLGNGNDNLLSFPMAGYTLALDFPQQAGLSGLLQRFDAGVCDAGGRIYLSKDGRMSGDVFRRCYPHWEALQEVRRETGADRAFCSLQSERLGL